MNDERTDIAAPTTACLICEGFPRYEPHATAPGCLAHRSLRFCHSPAHGMTVDRADGRGLVCLDCDRSRCRRIHDGGYLNEGPEAEWLTRESERGETMENIETGETEPAASAANELPAETESPEGVAPPGPQQMVTLSPGEGAVYLEVKKGVQVLFAGHQITHEVLGAIVRHLISGEPLKMAPGTWAAIGVDPKSRPLVVSPNGFAV